MITSAVLPTAVRIVSDDLGAVGHVRARRSGRDRVGGRRRRRGASRRALAHDLRSGRLRRPTSCAACFADGGVDQRVAPRQRSSASPATPLQSLRRTSSVGTAFALCEGGADAGDERGARRGRSPDRRAVCPEAAELLRRSMDQRRKRNRARTYDDRHGRRDGGASVTSVAGLVRGPGARGRGSRRGHRRRAAGRARLRLRVHRR